MRWIGHLQVRISLSNKALRQIIMAYVRKKSSLDFGLAGMRFPLRRWQRQRALKQMAEGPNLTKLC
jgi:hypothetical protein